MSRLTCLRMFSGPVTSRMSPSTSDARARKFIRSPSTGIDVYRQTRSHKPQNTTLQCTR